MSLTRFPYLKGLLDDLSTLAAEEAVQLRVGAVMRQGRDLTEVTIPWLGKRYWCSPPQREVIRQLIHAQAHCASPDVDEPTLLRRSRAKSSKLADLFRGHPAWGELILPGERAATFRISPPPEEIVEEVRVEPEG